MNLFSGSLPIAFFGFEPWMIAIAVPVAGLIFAGVIAISAMYFKHQQKLAWHETARLALEKGQPMPPSPISDEEVKDGMPPAGGDIAGWQRARREQQQRNDVRTGLILIAVGAGLFVMLRSLAGSEVQYVGAIPGLIGVAMLVHGLLDRMFASKNG
jgi:hypothetical protein